MLPTKPGRVSEHILSSFENALAFLPFYKAILWGYQEKITKGYTTGDKRGTFGIDEDCTRGQIVTFLYRLW